MIHLLSIEFVKQLFYVDIKEDTEIIVPLYTVMLSRLVPPPQKKGYTLVPETYEYVRVES